MTAHHDDGTVTDNLDSLLAAFEREHPEVIAELDQLGMQIDDYARLLSEFDPSIITASNTTGKL